MKSYSIIATNDNTGERRTYSCKDETTANERFYEMFTSYQWDRIVLIDNTTGEVIDFV